MARKINGSALLRIAIVTAVLLGLLAAGTGPAAAGDCWGEDIVYTEHETTDEDGDGEDDTYWYLYIYEDGSSCVESGPLMYA